MRPRSRILVVLVAAAAGEAFAAEPDPAVVRNRLYTDDGRLELQVSYSFSLSNTITATQGPLIDIGYHFTEAWAVDLLAAWMFGGPTNLAGNAQCPDQLSSASGAAANCQNPDPNSIFWSAQPANGSKPFNDLPSLWTLDGPDIQLGLRWEPVYGKLSLVAAVPVHFKWYVGLYGGVAQLSRDSFDFCTNYNPNAPNVNGLGDCATTGSLKSNNLTYETLQETRWSWIASAATGFRFVLVGRAALDLGLREYLWGDSYRVGFSGRDFPVGANGNPPAGIATKTGLTPSLFADLGLSWTF